MLKKILAPAALGLSIMCSQAWSEQTWMVNFKDSEIQEVIKFVADVTGRTVAIDQRVKGRVKVISSQPLNEEQLLDLFRTVLTLNGFTTVDSDGIIRVIPMKDARNSPVPITDQQTDKKGFITQVIQLQNIAAAKVLPVIRPLVPQHAHLAAYDPANAIVISDFKANIDRIRNLIERIDKSATPVTEIVELKYASAEDMVNTLSKLEQDTQKRTSAAKKIELIADKRNNAVLITGEDLQRERIKQLIARLDKPTSQTGQVRVVYLNYAKAKATAEVLTKVVANLSKLGPGGDAKAAKPAGATVEADEDTNALLITAEGDELASLLQVVERLDIRRAQVLVEAIIVQLTEDTSKELGIEFLFRDKDNAAFGSSINSQGTNANIIGAALQGATEEAQEDGSAESLAALTGLATSLTGAPGQTLGVLGTNPDVDFGAILRMIQDDSKNNILSTPTLLTMDNNEATFSSGENVPFRTGSFSNTGSGISSPFTTVQRQDVGIILKVTPHVNEGDKVILDISQEISAVGAETADGLRTTKSEIETQVMAADGEIIVMGGLVQDEKSYGASRVPYLSKIPFLGRLFRSDNSSAVERNLMIFLKASIIRKDDELSGATAEKYQAIRDKQLQMRDRGFLRLKDTGQPLVADFSVHDIQKPYVVETIEDSSSEGDAGETSEDADVVEQSDGE